MVALAASEFGAAGGRPLLILHGLFGSRRNWGTAARRLAETRRVIAVDLRNHGESPWDDDVSYAAMAGDCLDYLDGQGIAQADVLGHSMGGKVAMVMALGAPERVDRLIVADIAPVAYRVGSREPADAMLAMRLDGVASRADADAALADAVPDAAERGFLLQNLVRKPDGFAWRINLAALTGGMDEIGGFPDAVAGKRFEGPALFVAGGRSRYIRPEHEPAIRALFPKAAIETIAESGHWLHVDAPDAFIDAVETFLDAEA